MEERDPVQKAVREGKIEAAYARALAENDPRAPLLKRLADVKKALYRRDPAEARRLAEGLKALLPELGEALDDLAAGRYSNWLEAGPAFIRAEAWVQKGVEAALAGQKEAAREAFERALKLDAGHPRALVNRGNLKLEEGTIEAAIADYQAALSLDPDLADAHHNLAAAYKKKGDIDRMVRHLKRAQRLRLYPPRVGAPEGAGRPPIYTRFWFWLLLTLFAYVLLQGLGGVSSGP